MTYIYGHLSIQVKEQLKVYFEYFWKRFISYKNQSLNIFWVRGKKKKKKPFKAINIIKIRNQTCQLQSINNIINKHLQKQVKRKIFLLVFVYAKLLIIQLKSIM